MSCFCVQQAYIRGAAIDKKLESVPYEAVVDSTAGVKGGTARREEVYSHMIGHFQS